MGKFGPLRNQSNYISWGISFERSPQKLSKNITFTKFEQLVKSYGHLSEILLILP